MRIVTNNNLKFEMNTGFKDCRKFSENVIGVEVGKVTIKKTMEYHGDITLNWSNNSVFLLKKSFEIAISLISSTPREFE